MKNNIKNICVYSASSTKLDPIYYNAANELGRFMAQRKINLVNGAGGIGLMKSIADAVLDNGGKVKIGRAHV